MNEVNLYKYLIERQKKHRGTLKLIPQNNPTTSWPIHASGDST